MRVLGVAAATIRGRGLVEEMRYHHHYGVCKTFVVAAAALLSTKNLTSRKVKVRNSLHFCLTKTFFAFESIAAHDEIQFLEFMGGSNSTHAHSNYLICMRFIRISTVVKMSNPKMCNEVLMRC